MVLQLALMQSKLTVIAIDEFTREIITVQFETIIAMKVEIHFVAKIKLCRQSMSKTTRKDGSLYDTMTVLSIFLSLSIQLQ